MISSRERVLHMLTKKDETEAYVEKNKDFFYENIVTPDRVVKVYSNCIFTLGEDNISYILQTFFLSISEDLFLFYEKLKDEKRIIKSVSIETAFTSLDNSNTIIFIKELKDLFDLLILVHEIGRAYYYKLNNIKLSDVGNIEEEIKEMIPAKVMAIKFIDFLRKNDAYEQSMVLRNFFDYFYYDSCKDKYDYNSLKDIIASDIAITVGKDVNIEEFYKYVYETNVRKLVLENSLMKGNSYKKRI
jgi:hypothetical protein